MPLKLLHAHHHSLSPLIPSYHLPSKLFAAPAALKLIKKNGASTKMMKTQLRNRRQRSPSTAATLSSSVPLDLTEDNIEQVLADARTELAQLFDASVNITGKAELAELDGPYVKIRLSGRFWHERSMVLARLGNYLKQRIPVSLLFSRCHSLN
ncbi:hypothetical protein PHJA_000016600 [Phtheirospermum japonicum]|uniref:Uncharacterized protein n=1 Tax=Phtheirospermum japonicum TaxID=374723 RepID=A0A830AWD0_9LAMI|nr:hypothetical protein PHJA_000016600 [Phtheirospermum japonicum]